MSVASATKIADFPLLDAFLEKGNIMNSDVHSILTKLFVHEPIRATGYAHALSLGTDKSQSLNHLIWCVCRFDEDIDLFDNLRKNLCFFKSKNELEDERYFVVKSNYGYVPGTFFFPKLGTVLVSKKEIFLPNTTPITGCLTNENWASIEEKEKLFQKFFTKKNSCLNNCFLDIFLPSTSDCWNHYVLAISRYSLFLSKLEFDQKVTN